MPSLDPSLLKIKFGEPSISEDDWEELRDQVYNIQDHSPNTNKSIARKSNTIDPISRKITASFGFEPLW